MNEQSEPLLLDAETAARLMRMSPQKVAGLMELGQSCDWRLPSLEIDGVRYTTRAWIEVWADRCDGVGFQSATPAELADAE